MSYSSNSSSNSNSNSKEQEQEQRQDFEYKDIEYKDIEFEDDNHNKGVETEERAEPLSTPHYRRLTFISLNACDFCTHVTKPGPYMHYLSFETKNGWASCGQEE